LVVADVLASKHEHGVLVKRAPHGLEGCVVQRLAQVEAQHLGTDMGMHLADDRVSPG
jgi:hypothetical protein